MPASPIHIEDMRKAAAGNTVVIAGTGVSVALSGRAPTASWAGLLQHGVEWCGANCGCKIDFDPNEKDAAKLIAAADAVRKAFSKDGDYSRWLREAVGALRIKERALADALCGLSGIVATTNYDGLIEAASGRSAVAWMDRAKVDRVLHGDSLDVVLHLHGYWEEPESVVFDTASYTRVMDDEHTQAILRTLLLSKTVIFVGYGSGLDDPNFGRLSQWIERVMRDSPYSPFRLVLDKDVAGAKGSPVQAVSYGTKYGDLPGFIQSLAPPRHRAEATTQPAYFFGRDQELKEVVEHVCGNKPAPALVIGGPGMGKTTLTLAALHHETVKRRFDAGGRVFVRCEACPAREQVVRAMALALGVKLAGNLEEAVLSELAAQGSVLLVLDNLETPLNGDREPVSRLLAEVAGVEGVVLLGSLRGAQRPLTVHWHEPWEMGKLDPVAARDAFLAMAGHGFAKDSNLEWLLREAAGYIAYPIALLAAEAQGQPSLLGLRRRWELLGTKVVDLLERSFDFSISSPAMTVGAHRLMRLLAMLPDGVDGERDLAALFDSGEDVEAAAAKLRAMRLVYDEGPRLRLLPPLRVYVARALPPDEADGRRLVSHYFELVAVEGRRLGFSGGQEAAGRLAPEAGNLEALLVAGPALDAQPRLVAALQGWAQFARFTGAGSSGPVDAAVKRLRTLGTRPADLAACMNASGNIALRRSDYEGARQRYEEALPLYRLVGDVLREANCIKSLGNTALQRSDHEGARKRYEEALPLYRRLGDVLGEANCIRSLGDIELERSDHERARQRYEQALALHQRIPEPHSIGDTHLRLARIARTPADKKEHVAAARANWLSIDRPDLVAQLDAEFGETSARSTGAG